MIFIDFIMYGLYTVGTGKVDGSQQNIQYLLS